MKKNKLITLTVIGTVALTGLTVYASRVITEKILCPNCNTEIEVERKAEIPGGGRTKILPRTTEELKKELAEQVSLGKITQEEMDNKIAQHEKMQKKMEERKAEEEKKLEEYKTELSAKVASGEITQEEMDKLMGEYGNRKPVRNFEGKPHRRQRNGKGEKHKMNLNEK